MLDFNQKIHSKVQCTSHVLVGDIGGTTTDFGILGKKNGKIILLVSIHYKSRDITNFTSVVADMLAYVKGEFGWTLRHACFAAACPISKNATVCNLTNLNLHIRKTDLCRKTSLRHVTLINDFQAIAYGVSVLRGKQLVNAKRGKSVEKAPRVVLGAGTGLGKGILLYDDKKKIYVPFSSEGGHTPLPIINKEEFQLLEFIRKRKKHNYVEWEDVLSGRGLVHMYLFAGTKKKFTKTKYSKEVHSSGYNSRLISLYKHKDKHCHAAFLMFLKFYGRCAKSFALDTMAVGGVYIAGGIAADNAEIFTHDIFRKEFTFSEKMGHVLEKIPVTVIADYNVSLYGAAVVAFSK